MNSDPINDLVVGGIDQNLPLEKSQKDIIKRIDSIIEESVKQGDPDIAGDALSYLLGMSRISGLSLAKLIYTFKYQWKNFKRRDTFEEYIQDYVGVEKVTIKRYYKVWDMLVSESIPGDYVDKIKLLPIKSLVPISNLWDSDYEIETKHWKRLADAPDTSTVNKIIREIKGVEPKSGSLQIELEEDGTLVVWKDGQKEIAGVLYVNSPSKNIQKAISRLVGDGRVLEK